MKISAHYLEKLRILLILLPIQVTSFLILPIEESISPAFPSKRYFFFMLTRLLANIMLVLFEGMY